MVCVHVTSIRGRINVMCVQVTRTDGFYYRYTTKFECYS